MNFDRKNDSTQLLEFELNDNIKMLNTLVDILGSIVECDSLENLFLGMTKFLCQHIGFEKSLFVVREQEKFHVLADYNFPENTVFKQILPDEKSLCFCVNDIGSSMLVNGFDEDLRFDENEIFDTNGEKVDVISRCFRIDDEVMGIFFFYNPTGDFFLLKNAHDKINYLMSVFAPHLELKIKSLEKIIEKDINYLLLAENMSDSVWTIDMDFNITYMSPSSARLCKFSKNCIVYSKWDNDNYGNLMDFFHGLDADEIKAKISGLKNNDKVQNWPTYEIKPPCQINNNGGDCWVECRFSPFYDKDGREGMMVVVRNISEKVKAREEEEIRRQKLIQADKMITLGILVSGVAHEINNPNNFIKLNSPMLKEMYLGFLPILDEYKKARGDFLIAGCQYSEVRDNISELFSGIITGADRIDKIVSELKDYVRGTDEETIIVCDINDTLKSAIKLTNGLIMKSTESFTVSYGVIPPVKINPQRIEQVIINLIQNSCHALKSSKSAIYISTSLDKDGKHVVCEISDEGRGIKEEDLKLIFEPFYTTRRESGGLGLGLSVSDSIVKKNGGRLSFKSIVDKGTSAFLKLPVNEKGDL